ncbi:MAG TPA: hypothetical protein VGF91_13745 [Solirubrobacteraceae bacterium]
MSRMVDIDDLVDAHGVAQMLGLSHPNTVSVYQHRYEEMPRPVIDLGRGRVKLWLRPEIEEWSTLQSTKGRSQRRSAPR